MIVNKKIDELKPYLNNAKKHTEKQIKQVAESIKRFGFIQPIVVDKNNEIVIGHCRYEAGKYLELKTVPCILVDKLSDDEVKALRLADNKLNESDWDFELVLNELDGFDTELIDLTGFDFRQLSDSLTDFSEKNKEVDIGSINDSLKNKCPKCGFKF